MLDTEYSRLQMPLRLRGNHKFQFYSQQWKKKNTWNTRVKNICNSTVNKVLFRYCFFNQARKRNLKLEKVNTVSIWKRFILSSSKECTGISTRIFLVSVSVGQPNTQDLCETEEEANATNKSQYFSSISSYYRSTRWAWVATFNTAGQAGVTLVRISKSAAV